MANLCCQSLPLRVAAVLLLSLSSRLDSAHLSAREIFVAPSGSDTAAGTQEAPLATLGQAIQRAVAGDTITLAAGEYAGSLLIRTPRLTIQSAAGERAVIRAGEKGTNVYLDHCEQVTLRNLDLAGGNGYGVDFDQAKRGLMEGCRCYDVQGEAIKVSPYSDHVTIRNCEIFRNQGAAEGIDALGVDYLTVRDCYIHDIQKNGAYAKGGSRYCVFERCVFHRCGLHPTLRGAGVILGQAGGNPRQSTPYQNADSVVRNCLFVDIEGAAMAAWEAQRPTFYNNTCYQVAKSDRAAMIILGGKLPSEDVTFLNNIVVVHPNSRRHLFWIYAAGLTGKLTMAGNRYYGGSGLLWDERPGGGLFSLAAWQQKYGADLDSSIGDPGLDKAGHLLKGSPCIDAGVAIRGLVDDVDGGRRTGKPDIGADEFGVGAALPFPPEAGVVGTGFQGLASAELDEAATPGSTETPVAQLPAAPLAAELVSVAEPAVDDDWGYVEPMKKVAADFSGTAGVVLHIGDSITYSNPYGQWARFGKGKTPADVAILKWMHLGAEDATDGWYLARVDRPGGRSETACSGIRADQMLAGGKSGLPALRELLAKYQPQMVVLMLGTNDASANRPVRDYLADMTKMVDLLTARHAIPILSTIPPHVHRPELAQSYNDGLRALAKRKGLPVIDYEQEILNRRPTDWNGTLLHLNDVHPSSTHGGVGAADEPTAANLTHSGYLLRGWLSVRKIAQVKARVFDGEAAPQPKPDVAPPGAVGQFRSPAAQSYSVTLEWTEATDDKLVVGYHIHRGAEDQFPLDAENRLNKTPLDYQQLSYQDELPPAGTTAWYAVTALDAAGKIGAPRYLAVEVPANQPPSVADLKLTATGASQGVMLAWQVDVAPDVVAIEVLRGEGEAGELTQVVRLDDPTRQEYHDKSLAPGKAYRYALRLVDRDGLKSAASESIAASPLRFARRVNCGGPEIASPDGIPWEADNGDVLGSARYSLRQPLSRAGKLADVYQSERWSYKSIVYRIPAPVGKYRVVLHFAETNPTFAKVGKRTFDVVLNEETVVEKLDIFSKVGASAPYVVTHELKVTEETGKVSVSLPANPTGPAIKGLEILSID